MTQPLCFAAPPAMEVVCQASSRSWPATESVQPLQVTYAWKGVGRSTPKQCQRAEVMVVVVMAVMMPMVVLLLMMMVEATILITMTMTMTTVMTMSRHLQQK